VSNLQGYLNKHTNKPSIARSFFHPFMAKPTPLIMITTTAAQPTPFQHPTMNIYNHILNPGSFLVLRQSPTSLAKDFKSAITKVFL
jgi:hypothetical protein